jgi:hypothetical protein
MVFSRFELSLGFSQGLLEQVRQSKDPCPPLKVFLIESTSMSRGSLMGIHSIDRRVQVVSQVLPGPQSSYLPLGRMRVSLSQPCHGQHLAGLIGIKDLTKFDLRRYLPTDLNQHPVGLCTGIGHGHGDHYTVGSPAFNTGYLPTARRARRRKSVMARMGQR